MTLSTLIARLNWPLVLGLAALALIRPLFSIVGLSDALGKPGTPLVLTATITLTWALVVGLNQVREPVVTLVASGLAYAVMVIGLSAVLSPILTGELQGPLAMPLAIIPLLVTNALWGVAAGGLALLIRGLRDSRHRGDSGPTVADSRSRGQEHGVDRKDGT